MEIQEENMINNLGNSCSNNDISYIAKGKRTKRQRPQSPIVLPLTTCSSSSGHGDGIDDDHQMNSSMSPTSSTTEFTGSTTEEEEDMANCLILLAKGHGSNYNNNNNNSNEKIDHHHHHHHQEEDIRNTNGNNNLVVERFNSRRFTETTTSTGKAGFYVYECKTCSRCFPSFQALGGHRASHKKPKNMIEDHHKKSMVLSEDETQILPIQISNNKTSIGINNNNNNNNKSKVHECSICGSEFSSGQALGGHMRRHRTTTTSAITTTTTTTNNKNPVIISESEEHPKQKTRNLLSLDLNLPAPQEDDRSDGKFSFGSSKQSLVFSASALVDCHY